jgi:hypothetical protein
MSHPSHQQTKETSMIRPQILFLVVAIGSTALAANAHAQQGAAQVFHSKGTNVGTFVNFGPGVVCPDGSEGFATGFGFVFASDSISHQPGGPPTSGSGVSVDIFGYFDTCGTSIGFGIGGLSGGYNAPNPALTSAEISGNLLVQDLDTGASFPMGLDLVLTGEGAASTNKGTTVIHDAGPYKVIVEQGASKSRQGGVTGTITLNGAQPDASFSSTTLNSNSSATVTVQKQN